jgi:hypothetical protein
VAQEGPGASVEGRRGDDGVACPRQIQEGQGLRRLPARGGHGCDAPFEVGDASLEDVDRGVHDPRVDVAELPEPEELGGVVGGVEDVGGGRIDGNGACAGGGIGLIPGAAWTARVPSPRDFWSAVGGRAHVVVLQWLCADTKKTGPLLRRGPGGDDLRSIRQLMCARVRAVHGSAPAPFRGQVVMRVIMHMERMAVFMVMLSVLAVGFSTVVDVGSCVGCGARAPHSSASPPETRKARHLRPPGLDSLALCLTWRQAAANHHGPATAPNRVEGVTIGAAGVKGEAVWTFPIFSEHADPEAGPGQSGSRTHHVGFGWAAPGSGPRRARGPARARPGSGREHR